MSDLAVMLSVRDTVETLQPYPLDDGQDYGELDAPPHVEPGENVFARSQACTARWTVKAAHPGAYLLQITYSNNQLDGASHVTMPLQLTVGSSARQLQLPATNGWQSYRVTVPVQLEQERNELELFAASVSADTAVRIAGVKLIPALVMETNTEDAIEV
ncbi:MAG: hypothetical protein LIO46_00780 [Clostridiales bacterium]|nr:hypothetical protein [Clostridiales bacterium]